MNNLQWGRIRLMKNIEVATIYYFIVFLQKFLFYDPFKPYEKFFGSRRLASCGGLWLSSLTRLLSQALARSSFSNDSWWA